jgi:hypothetical protein
MSKSPWLNNKTVIGILLSFLFDINPRNWLKPFSKKSIWYLVAMGIFYHGISIGLMYAGAALVTTISPEYESPSFPVSIVMAATSGPIEETLFFGIPYLLSGNPHSMLVTGAIWSIAHIFNTQVFSFNSLGYVSFLITIPHVFFSLRVWSGGKGWFAIAFHSVWNLAFLLSYCSVGLRGCTIFGTGEFFLIDVFALSLAGSLIAMASLLYFKNKITNVKFRASMIISVLVFVISEIVINVQYFQIFFS